jgi:hypothetical protein
LGGSKPPPEFPSLYAKELKMTIYVPKNQSVEN